MQLYWQDLKQKKKKTLKCCLLNSDLFKIPGLKDRIGAQIKEAIQFSKSFPCWDYM